jgi:hypothetical protein
MGESLSLEMTSSAVLAGGSDIPKVPCTALCRGSLKWQFHDLITMSGIAAAPPVHTSEALSLLAVNSTFAWLHPVENSKGDRACDLLGPFSS